MISYPVLILLAMLASGWALRRTQRRLPLTAPQKLAIGVGAFLGAMIGAKLPFVLSDWDGLWDGTAWFAHGKTIMTGLAGGYLGVEIAKWMCDIRVKTGDTFAVPVALAVAIGRLACFQAGCCYGKPTTLPWGAVFPTAPDPMPRHPTQIYESAFHFVMAIVVGWMASRPAGMGRYLRGQWVKFYILAYFAYRFVSEFLRPEPPVLGGLTGYQWTALALAPVFIWLWLRDAAAARDAADGALAHEALGSSGPTIRPSVRRTS
jgi:phosphatidylglycerol:prolipoprotein diacylglycerol transferase